MMTKLMKAFGAEPTATATLFDNIGGMTGLIHLAVILGATVLYVTWVSHTRVSH